MLYIYPDYYPAFRCIADKCLHSCCIGWEIDIDPDSLERFRAADDIMEHVEVSGREAFFRMRADGRCPFLNESGLCRMILRYGEDMLCDICSDHPRFRNFFSDRTEIGLGLCCEAFVRQLLDHTDPVRLLVNEDGDPLPPLTEDEAYILSARDRMIAILQDRSIPIKKRMQALMDEFECALPDQSGTSVRDLLLSLERLDPAWDRVICALHGSAFPLIPARDILSETAMEQLAVYFIYRHIAPACEDDDLYGRVCLCVFLWQLVCTLIGINTHAGEFSAEDICRMLSSELEYSDENIARIIEWLCPA